MSALLTGGCGCGAVRFEVTAPFVSASYCHCTRCQRRTGTAASANARVEPGQHSGRRRRGRAAVVGARGRLREGLLRPLRVGALQPAARLERLAGVRLGAVDGDPGIRPQWHQYTDVRRGLGAAPRRRAAAPPRSQALLGGRRVGSVARRARPRTESATSGRPNSTNAATGSRAPTIPAAASGRLGKRRQADAEHAVPLGRARRRHDVDPSGPAEGRRLEA